MDAELAILMRLRDGDDAALRDLYGAIGANVFALARRMTGSREDAEEVVQDTFVKVFDNAARFDPVRGSVRAWVYTIARNECRMRLRARGSRPRPAEGLDPHAADSVMASSDPAGGTVNRLTLEQAFEVLAPDEAALLGDAFLGGYSHSEIAERDGVPLGTVKSRIRRAMLKAREALTRTADRRRASGGSGS